MTPASPQLQLHPDRSDLIDVTWWPRSGNLAAELPDLITALSLRTGPISRVVYDPNAWSATSPSLRLGDSAVQLDPYPFEVFGTMYAYGANGTVTVLQAIPSAAD